MMAGCRVEDVLGDLADDLAWKVAVADHFDQQATETLSFGEPLALQPAELRLGIGLGRADAGQTPMSPSNRAGRVPS